MDRVVIVIPAYNEGRALDKLLASIKFPLGDIIVVDDGSTDNTASVSHSAGVRIIRHKKNMGKGVALRTGFRDAIKEGAGWVVTMDADGQHCPGDVPLFLKAVKADKGDIIIGEREVSNRTMPTLRFLTNLTTSFIVSILGGKRVRDSQSGFRVLKSEVLSGVSVSTDNFQAESEIIIKAARKGFRVTSVPIKTIYNESNSHIRPFLDTLRFINLVLQSLWRQ